VTLIEAAVAALGPGPLEGPSLRRHIDPLFSRVLSQSENRIYLANHSLGRPLDRMAADVEEGLALWYADLDRAWDGWLAEIAAFRSRVARLLHAAGPQCIVPKANAGQGLRAVLNCFDRKLHVIATRSEFSSIDVILKAYAARGSVHIDWVVPGSGPRYQAEDFAAALKKTGPDLLVVSLVLFDTGQLLTEIEEIIALAQAQNTLVLIDLYHAAGVLPVDITALDADFAIGGGYKYLRGGPGAAWLYIHPRHFEAGLRTLDIGWFATSEPMGFARPERPAFARDGDGWLDSTPAILPFYQARAGLEFALAIGVERLRSYSLRQQRLLAGLLEDHGVSVPSANEPRGAFLAIEAPQAETAAARLCEEGVIVDARENLLRLCPDILSTPRELETAVARVAEVLRAP
jgi:kynureninase